MNLMINRRFLFLFVNIVLTTCCKVSAQELSVEMQKVYDACRKMSISIGTGSQTGLQAANKALKDCDTGDFGSIRCMDTVPLTLDGHFVFDVFFVDSLIAGRNVYKFAQRYASDRILRGVSSSGKIFLKNGAVRGLSTTKYSFGSRGRQELAVVAESGGLITLRVYDKTHKKWYNDIKNVKKGCPSRILVFSLPESELSLLELEIINTTAKDVSFVIISN